MAYGQVNADVIGTSVSGSNLGAGNASIMKNRIINGSMTVDQRNAGASVTVNTNGWTYSVDRFAGYGQATDGAYTLQQSSTAPTGFTNSLKATVTTADSSIGAGQLYFISQAIEGFNIGDLGWGTASAKTVTLSFWVQSSLTGTFGGSVINGGYTRSYPFTYTISSANTWEQKTITISGDTTGTWATNNTVGLYISLNLGCGSTYSGTAGSWAGSQYWNATGSTQVISTLSATFYITGVQLEVGSSATGYEYRLYNQELSACQRYYEVGGFYGCAYGNATNGVNISFPMKVTKRTTPTGTLTDASYVNWPGPLVGADNANTVYLTVSSAPATGFVRGIATFNISAEL
jgi:hypothetical protein